MLWCCFILGFGVDELVLVLGQHTKLLSISRQPRTSAKVLERRGHWSIRKVKSLVFPFGKYEASRFYELTPSACSACAAWPVGFSSCLAFFQLCECMRRALNALKPIGPDQRRTVEEFWFWLLRLCLRHCYGIQRTLKCVSMCCGFQGVPLVVSHRRRARRGSRMRLKSMASQCFHHCNFSSEQMQQIGGSRLVRCTWQVMMTSRFCYRSTEAQVLRIQEIQPVKGSACSGFVLQEPRWDVPSSAFGILWSLRTVF